nr:putative reverse transcriptase domain-containing protein [Tanacetum cinerariifolium]
ELALLCPGMVTPKYKKVECYILGLIEDIQGKVTASKLTNIEEAIRMAHDLMDQFVHLKISRDQTQQRSHTYTLKNTTYKKR